MHQQATTGVYRVVPPCLRSSISIARFISRWPSRSNIASNNSILNDSRSTFLIIIDREMTLKLKGGNHCLYVVIISSLSVAVVFEVIICLDIGSG